MLAASEVLAVKLFVSALLLAAVPAVFAQNQVPNQGVVIIQSGQELTPQQKNAIETAQAKMRAQVREMLGRLNQAGCPLYLESASVAPHAGYLPVGSRGSDGGALHLHFRNESGKAIASASITVQLKSKRSIYDLDASVFTMPLTVSGVDVADKAAEQMRSFGLPDKMYLYGAARVTLDQVTFADGSTWTASPSDNTCHTGPLMGIEQIAK